MSDGYTEFEVGDFVIVTWAGQSLRGTVTEVDIESTSPYRVLFTRHEDGERWFPAHYLDIDPNGDL